MLFDSILPGIECRTQLIVEPGLRSPINFESLSNRITAKLANLGQPFSHDYLIECQKHSEYLLGEYIPPLPENLHNQIVSSFLRLPDILSVLSFIPSSFERELTEVLGCITMECCHIMDDVLDAPVKSLSSGYSRVDELLSIIESL